MSNEFNQYCEQLRTVEEALLCSTDPIEKESLESLKNDLKELLELTRESIDSSANKNASKYTENHGGEDHDDEMSLFLKEISEIDKNSELDELLESKIGEKCSAPHHHSWGTKTYHNAIICGLDESSDTPRLLVLFTNPTHKEMIPCSYYLEGECRFESDKCHFSHGEAIAFEELKDYKEPEFDKLARNCVVLAKMNDRMWHKGRVLCANFIEKSCRVRLDSQKKEIDFNFEDLFPIFHDEDLSSGSSSDGESDSDSDEVEAARRTRLIEQSLFSYAPNQPLGEWEKHTKGIGSKLMSKMGYITGTGLGWNGEGIITPISAQVLPPGKSLDHCMELREAANGDQDLFSVEKKLKQNQKRQETLNAKAYARESKKTDVFSFLNGTILGSETQAVESKPSTNPTMKNAFKNHTTKTLNVESVRIADDIRKKEREILKVKESMRRHQAGSDVHKRLKMQLEAKNQELGGLKKNETSLAKEQMSRKTKDKLCVF
ncbi:zinc finger CCCH-type with G patch domain-containing protein isoform X2 [Episyrphus balteatus]|uniref:zinc finger CCCH-type with G patch domain-containing protein isoform X2 n=1 Tax=Episyrphus balteatus TaxID=286459 RepID=UPI0024869CA9|nr:zinc finger CCCH-type with G patch domain-containing protein isoform X2 [Episyrphus balteatus]